MASIRLARVSKPWQSMKVLASPYLENFKYNPVQFLLYHAMMGLGIEIGCFSTNRLLFEYCDIWHLHWPAEDVLNRTNRFGTVINLFKFWAKLKIARAKGTLVVWTVHNVGPHERSHPRLESIFWPIFLGNLDGIICMSASGRSQLYDRHPSAATKPLFIIPHGHYRDAYPASVSRDQARRALGLKRDEFIAVFLGMIRAYKGVPHLIRCFKAAQLTDARLLVAGKPLNDIIARELNDMAGSGTSVKLFLDFIDQNDIQKFLRAADLVILPYEEISNSGSAILALSFDRPILVPAKGALKELHQTVGPGWIYSYEGRLTPQIIQDAFEWAKMRQNREQCCTPMEEFNWERIAKMTLEAFSRLATSRPKVAHRK